MDLPEVMLALEKAGTVQNRKIYARHGVRGDCFGVSYAELERLAGEIRTFADESCGPTPGTPYR